MNRSSLWPTALLAALLSITAAAQTPNPLHWLPGVEAAAKADPAPAPAAALPADYVIGPGDVIEINVWKETEISQTLPVRPDGNISLPLAGRVRAAGLTPEALQQAIAAQLSAFISHPIVTVMVTKIDSRSFSVLGAVLHPGRYPLLGPTRVLAALAEAGGLTPFAHADHVSLLHLGADGQMARYAFDYPAVIRGQKLEQDRELQPGDTLVVP